MRLYPSLTPIGIAMLAVLLAQPFAAAQSAGESQAQSQAQPQGQSQAGQTKQAPAGDTQAGNKAQPSASQPTDKQLDQVANITIQAKKVQKKHLPELADANPQEAKKIQRQMQAEAVELIKESGMTLDEYQNVMQAVQQDSTLKNKLVAKIKTKSKAE